MDHCVDSVSRLFKTPHFAEILSQVLPRYARFIFPKVSPVYPHCGIKSRFFYISVIFMKLSELISRSFILYPICRGTMLSSEFECTSRIILDFIPLLGRRRCCHPGGDIHQPTISLLKFHLLKEASYRFPAAVTKILSGHAKWTR